MKVELILSLPEGLEVTNIDVIDGVLTIFAVSTQQSACCPLCSSLAACRREAKACLSSFA